MKFAIVMFLHMGVSPPLHAGIHTPLGRHTLDRHPLGRHSPLWQTPPGQTTQLWQTPLRQTPFPHGQTHPAWENTPMGRHSSPWADTPSPWADPPAQCMLGYGQQAGGTHPTGMQSCLYKIALD